MAAQASQPKIQELYQLAKEHLSNGPPSQVAAAKIATALGTCTDYLSASGEAVIGDTDSDYALSQAPFPSAS